MDNTNGLSLAASDHDFFSWVCCRAYIHMVVCVRCVLYLAGPCLRPGSYNALIQKSLAVPSRILPAQLIRPQMSVEQGFQELLAAWLLSLPTVAQLLSGAQFIEVWRMQAELYPDFSADYCTWKKEDKIVEIVLLAVIAK